MKRAVRALEGSLKKICVLFTLLVVLLPLSALSQEADDSFLFPVVVRSPGAAGSMWVTEVCMTNPWSHSIVLATAFVQGSVTIDHFIDLQPNENLCFEDVVGRLLGESEWIGALYLWAIPELNSGVGNTTFAAIAKVYNDTPAGTLGASVPIARIGAAVEDTGAPPEFGVIPGVHNWGEAGVDGFRTSIGIFNPAVFEQRVLVEALHPLGIRLWSRWVDVPGLSFTQFRVPRTVQFANASCRSTNHGGLDERFPVLTYATVVDNRTNDGVFKSATVFQQDSTVEAAAVGPETANEDHLRKIFSELLDKELPVPSDRR